MVVLATSGRIIQWLWYQKLKSTMLTTLLIQVSHFHDNRLTIIVTTEESEGMLLESNTLLKPGKLTNIRTYNHQHALLLFSSLCLDISNKASKKPCEWHTYHMTSCDLTFVYTATSNSDYRQSAINIHLNCLKLLTYCLRASLCGAEGQLLSSKS